MKIKINTSVAITHILREVGQNFVMPIFNGAVYAATTRKKSDGTLIDVLPVDVARVGAQILIVREIKNLMSYDRVFGVNHLPYISTNDTAIIDECAISEPFSTERKSSLAFLDLAQSIVASGKMIQGPNSEKYSPIPIGAWLVRPLDGMDSFTKKEPKLTMEVSLATSGSIAGGWVYRPCQDEIFRSYCDYSEKIDAYSFRSLSEQVSFNEYNEEFHKKISRPLEKPLKDMTVVCSPANSSIALDDVTAPLYRKENGQYYSFDELKDRLKDSFKAVLPADNYSFQFGEFLLGKVDALCTPDTSAWTHFGQAYIAENVGYRATYIDGEDYLRRGCDRIPLIEHPKRGYDVRQEGGMLYAHPDMWKEVNWELNVKHHPLREGLSNREGKPRMCSID